MRMLGRNLQTAHPLLARRRKGNPQALRSLFGPAWLLDVVSLYLFGTFVTLLFIFITSLLHLVCFAPSLVIYLFSCFERI